MLPRQFCSQNHLQPTEVRATGPRISGLSESNLQIDDALKQPYFDSKFFFSPPSRDLGRLISYFLLLS